MSYFIPRKLNSNIYSSENDTTTMTILNGGIQVVPSPAAKPLQIIYLDFDGELTKYRNPDLNLTIDQVEVEDSLLTPERIAGIITELNTNFSVYNVLFTSERPKDTAYSTIFIGKTSAFNQYGSFAGLAETVDVGNQIKDDNAFVLLDSSDSDSDIVSTISHEVEHLIGTLEHGGDGLVGYADDEEEKKNPGYIYYYYLNNCSFTGEITTGSRVLVHSEIKSSIVSSEYQRDGGDAFVCKGSKYDKSDDITVYSRGKLYISSGGVANNIMINAYDNSVRYLRGLPGVSIFVGGSANSVTVNSGGRLVIYGGTATEIVENGGYVSILDDASYSFVPNIISGFLFSSSSGERVAGAGGATVHSGTTANDCIVNNGGTLHLYSGGIANNTIVDSGGTMMVYYGAMANNTIVSSSFIEISSGGTANNTTVNDNGYFRVKGIASNTIINSGGSLFVYGGDANNAIINSGGSLEVQQGTAYNVSVGIGGSLWVGYCGKASIIFSPFGYGDIQIVTGDYATATYIGKDKNIYYGNAISGILSSADTMTGLDVESGKSAIVYESGVLEDANVNSGGIVLVSNGGSAKDVSIAHGGSAFISSGGRIEQSFEINGQMTVDNGGIARIWSASTVKGESALLMNCGTIEFLVASATVGGEALLNDYTKVSGSGGYTITINGDQQSGEYRLIGNAAAFNRNITIKAEDSEETGTFQWNGSGYNTVTLDDRDYTLKLDEENNLVLTAGMSPTRVDFEFTEVGQTVYYNGEAPDGSTLEGVLMAIPYTADITVSFDKSLAEGLYEFTTSVAEVDGSVNHFNIQVADGILGSDGEPAPKSVSYVSDNMCYNGTLVSETDSTVTYKFTGVNDYLLIDSIPSDTLNLDATYQENGIAPGDTQMFDEVSGRSKPRVKSTKSSYSQRYSSTSSLPDANKKREKNYELIFLSKVINGIEYSILRTSPVIPMLPSNIDQLTITAADRTYNQYYYATTVYKDGKLYPNLKTTVSSSQNITTITIATNEYKEVFSNNIVLVLEDDSFRSLTPSGIIDFDDTHISNSTLPYAPWDINHCWIATACNMLEACGYLEGITAEACYQILNLKYYIKDNCKSEGGNPTRVFQDFLYSKLGVVYNNQKYCNYFGPDRIERGLEHLESCKGKVVAAISYWGEENHVFTCYSIDLKAGKAVCSNSDDGISGSVEYDLVWDGSRWLIDDKVIKSIVTLITRSLDSNTPRLASKDIKTYKVLTPTHAADDSNSSKVYASSYEGLECKNGFVIVSGNIQDSIVVSNTLLVIENTAIADEMVVHDGGAVTFNSGSNAKGSIRTTGGTLTVESGVDVSEAEFDFAVSRMDGGNRSPLLNSLRNVSGSKLTITIVNGQSAGKYVLASGASDFDGTLSVVGEYDYTQDVGEGFDNGLIGGLGLGNTLKIEDKTYSLAVEDDNLVLSISVDAAIIVPENLVSTAGQVSWKKTEAEEFIVEYSTDDFEHVIRVVTAGNAVDMPDLPSGTYQWRVKADTNSEWAVGEAITVAPEADATPKVVQSNDDGNDDLFFATANGTWENIYYAQNVGSINDWTGTNEIISADGKGRIQNLFFGSTDPNVLCLTDGENGDAIFVDDVYTDLPEDVAEHTARLYKIQEVRAGAGDDIVDMTSQRFEYVGDGLTIRGGDGNDTIWATKGDNWLFGDAGNDRIVGASKNDVIIGGIGNDRMHGGGGDDIFTFCDNWGTDEVEQLAGGSITLWFANGDESKWNAETLTYTDRDNSVTVKGVASVELKFGDDGSDQYDELVAAGAFAEFTSKKIFEESKGMLV